MWLAGREQRRNKAGAMLPILAGGREPNARGRTMTKPLKPMTWRAAESMETMKIYIHTQDENYRNYLEVWLVEMRVLIDATSWQPFSDGASSSRIASP
jgi:hypothetical protein